MEPVLHPLPQRHPRIPRNIVVGIQDASFLCVHLPCGTDSYRLEILIPVQNPQHRLHHMFPAKFCICICFPDFFNFSVFPHPGLDAGSANINYRYSQIDPHFCAVLLSQHGCYFYFRTLITAFLICSPSAPGATPGRCGSSGSQTANLPGDK